MGSHKKKGYTGYVKVSAPVPDYNVTGSISPDATCNYFYAGEHSGKPYYRRQDEAFYIWWNGLDTWYISGSVGEPVSEPYWYRQSANIAGDYLPSAEASGTATVSEGSH